MSAFKVTAVSESVEEQLAKLIADARTTEKGFQDFLESHPGFNLNYQYEEPTEYAWQGETFLTFAVRQRNLTAVNALIDRGIDVNLWYEPPFGQVLRATALSIAVNDNASNFQLAAVKALVAAGANVGFDCGRGKTALTLAREKFGPADSVTKFLAESSVSPS